MATFLSGGCFRPEAKPAGAGTSPRPVGPQSAGLLRFADHTDTSQIKFTYRSSANAKHAPILQEMGGGCGLLDIDRDGCLDAFFPGGGVINETGPQPFPHGMFQNLGNGTFRDVSNSSGLKQGRLFSQGVACGDYDADGFTDLIVTAYGGLQFFQNQGDGSFQEQTERAGLTDQLWSTSAAWGDVNGDGHLDLYLCHYVDWSLKNDPTCFGPVSPLPESCPPDRFKGLPDTLYLSTGSETFQDISTVAGLRTDGKGLGVVLADLDGDGDVDIYVANDTDANFLYRNDGCDTQGIPHFTEIGPESGSALNDSGKADGSIGVAILDLNHDSRPDLWVSNFELESPGLYRNEGGANFTHISRLAGVASGNRSFVSFGTVAADFDGDGDEDVMVTNGHVARYPMSGATLQPCQLFENLGESQFRDVAEQAGECLTRPMLGRGLASGDIDGDGDLDVVLSPKNEPARVFKNTQSTVPQWLRIELAGTQSPRDGKGAIVTLTRNGTQTIQRSYGGESYLSSCSSWLIFPDSQPSEPLQLQITWPSGKVQRLNRPAASAGQEWSTDQGGCRRTGFGLLIVEPTSRKSGK